MTITKTYLCEYSVGDEVCELEIAASSEEEVELHLQKIANATIVGELDEFEGEGCGECEGVDLSDEFTDIVNKRYGNAPVYKIEIHIPQPPSFWSKLKVVFQSIGNLFI
jgi:hypothetical protein